MPQLLTARLQPNFRLNLHQKDLLVQSYSKYECSSGRIVNFSIGSFFGSLKVGKEGNRTVVEVSSQSRKEISMSSHKNQNFSVAVIGAGAAGLSAARECVRSGHRVVVFEQKERVGGTWLYEETTHEEESDDVVPASSMYSSLRTNLPRECMSFLDFPFRRPPGSSEMDQERYCSHETVAGYLEHFAKVFNITPHIRFGVKVTSVLPLDSSKDSEQVLWKRWKVETSDCSSNYRKKESNVFDAVVVCNGHYSRPKYAEIPGIASWPGKQLHSHFYRRPQPFQGQVLVLIGASASGEDIARDVSLFAKEVHLCSRGWTAADVANQSPGGKLGNIWRHPMASRAHPDKRIEFGDGISVSADVIMHCTGYRYHFPFLKGLERSVKVEDSRVGPLYKHIFPPDFAPTLSFVGLPWQVAPFPLMEVQSKWIAKLLSRDLMLPSKEQMLAEIESFYKKMEEAEIPVRYTHSLGQSAIVSQFDYVDDILDQCGLHPVENWRKEMYSAASLNRRSHPDNYRNSWSDFSLVSEALKAQDKVLELNPDWYEEGNRRLKYFSRSA